MPNRAADIMRMMQGTMGAGGATPPQPGLSSNDLGRDLTTMMGPPPPPAGRFADNMDPEQLRRLMEMMQGTMGGVGKPAPDTSTLVNAQSFPQRNRDDIRREQRGTMGNLYGQPPRRPPIPPHGGTIEDRARDYYSYDYGWINPNVPYSRTGRQIPMSLLPRR